MPDDDFDPNHPTMETAKRCPKCGHPGEDARTAAAPASANFKRGTTIHYIYCRTELCPWFNTCWMVQVNPDGTVPPPKNHTGQAKIYAEMDNHDEIAQQLIEGIKREREMSQLPADDPRHEVRRRS